MSKLERPRVAILISGRGTNMDAILSHRDDLAADFVAVISSKAEAEGLATARDRYGLPVFVVDAKAYPRRADYDAALAAVLEEQRVDFIVLAGFMRILSDEFVRKYPGAIVNIHPSILPSFAGLHAQRQALEAGVRVSGCTVHFVAPGAVDTGPIIAQAVVPVYSDDSEDTLAQRIQVEEHRLYPAALRAIFEKRLRLDDERVVSSAREDEVAIMRHA